MFATQGMVPFLLLLISLGIYSHPLKKTGEQTGVTKPTTEPTTETLTETTTEPTTEPPCPGCLYETKCYSPGEEMSRGSDGQGWCFGMYCSYGGGIIAWDDWNCGPTTPPTTAPPRGCFENEQWYSPGSVISQGSDGEGWCYGTYCDSDGNIVAWDDWNCISTTTSPSTTQPNTAMPKPEGCFYNDKWFPPNKDISKECYETGWCHGIICGPSGHIVEWHGWKTAPTKPTGHP